MLNGEGGSTTCADKRVGVVFEVIIAVHLPGARPVRNSSTEPPRSNLLTKRRIVILRIIPHRARRPRDIRSWRYSHYSSFASRRINADDKPSDTLLEPRYIKNIVHHSLND